MCPKFGHLSSKFLCLHFQKIAYLIPRFIPILELRQRDPNQKEEREHKDKGRSLGISRILLKP